MNEITQNLVDSILGSLNKRLIIPILVLRFVNPFTDTIKSIYNWIRDIIFRYKYPYYIDINVNRIGYASRLNNVYMAFIKYLYTEHADNKVIFNRVSIHDTSDFINRNSTMFGDVIFNFDRTNINIDGVNVNIYASIDTNVNNDKGSSENMCIPKGYIRIFVKKEEELKKINKIIYDIAKRYDSNNIKIDNEKIVYVYCQSKYGGDGWEKTYINIYRNWTNSVYAKDVYTLISSKVDSFIKNLPKYRDLGLSRKISFMLYGIPGTGKSTIAYVLQSQYKRPIYIINSANIIEPSAWKYIKPGSIVLVDDIDRIIYESIISKKDEKKDDEEKKVDNVYILSRTNDIIRELLAILDGINILDDCIIITTTNNMDKIDPALIRPGRIDYKIEIKMCDEYQLRELCRIYSIEWNEKFNSHINNILPIDFINKFSDIKNK